MSSDECLILLCVISFLCCVSCELNLTEGSACNTQGLKGTCVNVFKCNSAALTYLYANAGYDMVRHEIPDLPDICSYKDNEPVVCCTDCNIGDEKYRNTAIGPFGSRVNKEGPVARQKCFDYFQSLPFPCRNQGYISLNLWLEETQCDNYTSGPGIVGGVGGRDAEKWEFPHVALIGYGDDVASAQWLCGGSVISERFILTAAHCKSTQALGNISFAALGLLKRSDPIETWKIYKIKRIIVHPEYKAPSKYHDIALLETEFEIAFGNDLLPACLDIGSEWKEWADASGWGRLGHRQPLADTLQVVSLQEFSALECLAMYQPHRHLNRGYDHDTQMCYGSHDEVVDTCEGESGGPLQVNDYECLYTIVGVTSYGKDCGILGSAGMYTRVSYYVPWIESVVWPEEVEARRKKDKQWLDT